MASAAMQGGIERVLLQILAIISIETGTPKKMQHDLTHMNCRRSNGYSNQGQLSIPKKSIQNMFGG